MARARLLKPGFFTNEDLCDLPPFGRLLFAGLWTLADKRGRLDDRPKRIKAQVFPYDDVDVVVLLDELESHGFIERYQIENAHFIQVVSFEKHQHVHKNEPESVIPANVGTTSDIVRTKPDIVGSRPAEAEAEAEANTEAEAEAKAERARAFVPNLAPPWDDDPEEKVGFAAEYVKHFRVVFKRDHPGASKVADAIELERDFGFDACMRVMEDTNWEKPPSWVRPKLEERAARASRGEFVAATPSKKSLRYDDS